MKTRRKNVPASMLALLAVVCVTACTTQDGGDLADQEDERSGEDEDAARADGDAIRSPEVPDLREPQPPPPQLRYVPLSIVTSRHTKQPGQSHRSSGNTSTEEAPGGVSGIYWEVLGQDPYNTRFNIKHDKTGGKDKVIFGDVHGGETTEYKPFRRLYVADPSGTSQPFAVVAWALVQGGTPTSFTITGRPLCGIRSAPHPQANQTNRSSGDFSTEEARGGTSKLRWSVLDDNSQALPNVRVKIWRDASGGPDPVIWSDLRHGSLTSYVPHRQLYVGNPTGATGHFFVMAHPE